MRGKEIVRMQHFQFRRVILFWARYIISSKWRDSGLTDDKNEGCNAVKNRVTTCQTPSYWQIINPPFYFLSLGLLCMGEKYSDWRCRKYVLWCEKKSRSCDAIFWWKHTMVMSTISYVGAVQTIWTNVILMRRYLWRICLLLVDKSHWIPI
jgi:hypothetical protein